MDTTPYTIRYHTLCGWAFVAMGAGSVEKMWSLKYTGDGNTWGWGSMGPAGSRTERTSHHNIKRRKWYGSAVILCIKIHNAFYWKRNPITRHMICVTWIIIVTIFGVMNVGVRSLCRVHVCSNRLILCIQYSASGPVEFFVIGGNIYIMHTVGCHIRHACWGRRCLWICRTYFTVFTC